MIDHEPTLPATPAVSPTLRLAMARDVSRAFLTTLDANVLAGVCVSHLRSLVQADEATVYFERTGGRLEALAGPPLDLPPEGSLAALLGTTGESMRLWTADLSPAAEVTPLVRALAAEGAAAALVSPLSVRDGIAGFVVVRRHHLRPFETYDLTAVDDIVGTLALALENARLYGDLQRQITELEHAQRELARRERLAAVGTMSAVLAHEVRSPLAVMVNALAAMRRAAPGSDDVPTLLGILDEEAQRLERLVDDLLEFARPHRRTHRNVDVSALVEAAVAATRQDPRVPPTVKVTFRAAQGDLHALWDAHGVRQAVVNLVLNGAQAIAAAAGTGEVHVSVERDGEMVVLAVTDDGCGVPEEVRDRMFDPFVTTRAQGSGLGLAVVRRVVEDHGGSTQVETEVGRGTRITLRLPRGVAGG